MICEKPLGLYLYKKNSEKNVVLKELLQFMRTVSPSHSNSFSYIGPGHSLHPHLSLWENLQLETGITNWRDFQQLLNPDQYSLVNLLKEPQKKVSDSETWESFLISLLKGIFGPSRNLLIDMNEALINPFIIENIKKCIHLATDSKTIYLASSNTNFWLDCAHSLIDRKEYSFVVENLNQKEVKKKQMA